MREAGPAVWLARHGVHAFTRYEVCREILADHALFLSGAGVGPATCGARRPGVPPASWRPTLRTTP
ncbi:hypothetical protein ACFQ0Q_43770 [Streptomyces aureus]